MPRRFNRRTPPRPIICPFFYRAGQTDVLMVVMAIILAVAVVGFGIFFLRLHTLPERVAHKATRSSSRLLRSSA